MNNQRDEPITMTTAISLPRLLWSLAAGCATMLAYYSFFSATPEESGIGGIVIGVLIGGFLWGLVIWPIVSVLVRFREAINRPDMTPRQRMDWFFKRNAGWIAFAGFCMLAFVVAVMKECTSR